MLADLAVMVRRESSNISRWESGFSPIPLDALETFCKHFDVTAEHLLGWDREVEQAA